jgi:hypothetical protein
MLLAMLLCALSGTKAFALQDYVMEAVRTVDARVGAPILIPGLVAAFLLATLPIAAKLLRSMEKAVKRAFLWGVTLFLVGGVALEAVTEYSWTKYGPNALAYILTSAIENLFEMAGASLTLFAILLQMQHRDIRAEGHFESILTETARLDMRDD